MKKFFIFIFGAILLWVMCGMPGVKTREMQYTELLENVEAGNVSSITLTNSRTRAQVILKNNVEIYYSVEIPETNSFMEAISENLNDNEFDFSVKSESILVHVLGLLPQLLLLLCIFFILKSTAGKSPLNIEVQKRENKTATKRKEKITFSNIAGLNEEKAEVQEIIDFLKNPGKYKKMGARMPKGVLLLGGPGIGKTLLAKAAAGEANVPFISMSGSEFVEMFAGLGAKKVRTLFEEARKKAPCIIFIDEIDAIGSKRNNGFSGADSEKVQTLNQLLTEMDGFEPSEGIVVMAATNRADILDPALLRSGRFDRHILINNPDSAAREEILKLYASGKAFDETVDFKVIAQNTIGFCGADLENLVNEAAILATRRGKNAISSDELEEAMIKVTMGPEKKSKTVSSKEKKLTAYHEAGHAVVSKFLPTHDSVQQISIIPRGMAGGYTMYKPNEDKSYHSKSEMKEHLVSLLGGRVAEQIVLNDISTGASNDIERATEIARAMVMKYGMSEKLGTINYTVKDSGYGNLSKVYSEKTAIEIDEEVKSIISDAYNKAEGILKSNIDKLHEVANALIKKEKIDAAEFEAIMNNC